LSEAERIEPGLAPESGEAGSGDTVANAAEKAIECRINAFQRCPLERYRNQSSLWVLIPPFSKSARLIEIGAGDSSLSVSFDSLLECGVVKLSLRFQDGFESAMLLHCWPGPVTVSEDHAQIIANR
jgi:hypothetical protein